MGDPACWIAQVCSDCGRVAEDLDDDGRCPDCVEAHAQTDRSISTSDQRQRHEDT